MSQDAFNILILLLPGFLTSFIFYGLTNYPKLSQFERILQALIFSALINIGVEFVEFCLFDLSNAIRSLIAYIFAVILGIVFTALIHRKKLEEWVREKRISKKSFLATEWEDFFQSNPNRFMILNLKDGRRLTGWPTLYSPSAETGHILVYKPQWILEEDQLENESSNRDYIIEKILIPSNEIMFIESYPEFKEEKSL